MKKRTLIASLITVLALILVAAAIADKPAYQKRDELISNQIADQQETAIPYPLSQMKDSLERRNLRERLLRFNKPNKVGYLYIMSFGKFVGYYVVNGKVSSVQSQMTNTTQTWKDGRDDNASQAVPSIGDDGSFGPNEGGDKGVFFFTSNGVMVETTLDWVYSDTPLNIDVKNLLKK